MSRFTNIKEFAGNDLGWFCDYITRQFLSASEMEMFFDENFDGHTTGINWQNCTGTIAFDIVLYCFSKGLISPLLESLLREAGDDAELSGFIRGLSAKGYLIDAAASA